MLQWWGLNRELARWASAGHRLQLWWRDDDARTPNPSLDRLMDLARRFGTPVTLAVVPDWDRSALGARLACERQAVVIQHGVDHRNAAEGGGPKAEFPDRYPREVMETRLTEARQRLSVMPRFAPVFAPAWNQVHRDLEGALRATGYCGLSAFGAPLSRERGFTRLDVHVSLMGAGEEGAFPGADALVANLTRLARARRRGGQWDQPIGLQTRHLDHSDAAWTCLEAILDRTSASSAVRWRSINDLLAGGRARRPVEPAQAAAWPTARKRGRAPV